MKGDPKTIEFLNTAKQIERAADGSQALALLLLSPEFQRR